MLNMSASALAFGLVVSSFFIPNIARAQMSSEDRSDDAIMSSYNRIISDREFAANFADELAICHGFQNELYAYFTRDIELSIPDIKFSHQLALDSQMTGLVSVFASTIHSKSVSSSSQRMNAVSRNARLAWQPKFQLFDERSKSEVAQKSSQCEQYKPIIEVIFADAIQQQGK